MINYIPAKDLLQLGLYVELLDEEQKRSFKNDSVISFELEHNIEEIEKLEYYSKEKYRFLVPSESGDRVPCVIEIHSITQWVAGMKKIRLNVVPAPEQSLKRNTA